MLKIFLIIVIFIKLSFAFSANLNDLSLQSSVLQLNLNQAVQPKLFQLEQPKRLVIDLPDTQLAKKISQPMRIGPYRLRLAEHSHQYLRIVIEAEDLKNFQIRSARYEGTSYIVSIALNTHAAAKKLSYTPIPPPRREKILVLIDPGHGGKDPGAFGYHRTREKDVVLAISRRLKRKIDAYPGMQAILTRDGDYFIDLRRRLEMTRHYRPDIFVAIHADAFTNPQSHGASVYALSQRGATSEAARWLAAKENYSELAGVNLRDLDDQNGMVRTVLIDLSQTATIQSSIKMGQKVLNYLSSMTSLHHRRVEQAGFLVLKSPDVPSILVETGFISNPYEERRLASTVYQEQLSQAIFNGIRQYFQHNPPRGHR